MIFNGYRVLKPNFTELNFSQSQVVTVLDDRIQENPCGHALLYVGGGFGHYFHTPGKAAPDFVYHLPGQEFSKYLHIHKKKELSRESVCIPQSHGAKNRLYKLLPDKYGYHFVKNNCVDFVEDILRAGGNFWDFNLCPMVNVGLYKVFSKKIRCELTP